LNRWYFTFQFKGNLLFKLQKLVSAALAKICGLSILVGRPLQITDSRKQPAVSGNKFAAIESISFPLQFKRITSGMPISAIIQ
jgi:hypothetical protein